MDDFFTLEEKKELFSLYRHLLQSAGDSIFWRDCQKLKKHLIKAAQCNGLQRNNFGMNPVIRDLQTAVIVAEEIGMKGSCLIGIMLHEIVKGHVLSIDEVNAEYGEDVASIIKGLVKTNELYAKSPAIESENFRNLLLSFAEDMRVILIMIADRVNVMRKIKDTGNEEDRIKVANEAAYLYAPLAHKLGLYKLKSELEDLSLKYTQKETYYFIKDKLNETKASRDKYIAAFIEPIQKKVAEAGLKFDIKGRTKSIHSIWNKIQKQKTPFEGIYDLFAIRIILDSEPDPAKEKQECWQVYSIVTDMYQPNPKRLRDWLSVPKSNGYESLHITVLGPEQKWVEVQIRTERMDEIAEKGLAAHWRYKGIKGDSGIDDWLNNIRAALEAGDSLQLMDQFKMDLYEDEVFVFTPKGDLLKFPKGSTVLDFAYHIHSGVGNKCVGGKINGRNVSFREVLHSGDTIEILTQNNQTPKQEWLNIVQSSRAKSKIRLALKELKVKDGVFAKEMLERKFKNRKIELEESVLYHLISKMGFKETSDFYRQLVDEKIDINDVVDGYIAEKEHGANQKMGAAIRSAEEFVLDKDNNANSFRTKSSDDELVIDRNLKGVDYSLAQCCHPIYGDQIFGFVTVNGGIKIHCQDCPNAPELRKRFGYRIVKARWSGKGTSQYNITLRVVGNDDLGIVNNITSIISKEQKIVMKSINIDSHDGLFSGNLNVLIDDTSKLDALLKKLRTVKGVKSVTRL